MLYMAKRRKDGVVSVGEVDDATCGGQPGSVETFNRGCQLIVNSEDEERNALSRGWRNSPSAALERFEAKEQSIAAVAAHRLYEDRNMSDAAKDEARAADLSSPEHLPEVPEARRRGRPPKHAA
jgi:hypothetical protein